MRRASYVAAVVGGAASVLVGAVSVVAQGVHPSQVGQSVPRRPQQPRILPGGSAPQTPGGPRIGYAGQPRLPQQGFGLQQRPRFGYGQPQVVYYPVPTSYGNGYGYGTGYSTVVDANGRPLTSIFDSPSTPYGDPAGTPDLTGSPFVVLEGGVMLVDFGNGDRRSARSCLVESSAMTPSGQPRTIFYRPPANGLLLRQGQQGRVQGSPPAGARMCYGLDGYGRVALLY